MTGRQMLLEISKRLRSREEGYQRQIADYPDFALRHSLKAHVNEIRDILAFIIDPLLAEEDKPERSAFVARETPGDRSETEQYELVYGTGGHDGPYMGYTKALEGAQRLLLGNRHERVIYIVPYSAPAFERAHAIDEVRRLLPERHTT